MGMSVIIALPTGDGRKTGVYSIEELLAGGCAAAVMSRRQHIGGKVFPGGHHIILCFLLSIPGKEERPLYVSHLEHCGNIVEIIIFLQRAQYQKVGATHIEGIPLSLIHI